MWTSPALAVPASISRRTPAMTREAKRRTATTMPFSMRYSRLLIAGAWSLGCVHLLFLCPSAGAADRAARIWPDASAEISLQPNRDENDPLPFGQDIAQGSTAGIAQGEVARAGKQRPLVAKTSGAERQGLPREYRSGVYAISTDYWLSYPKSVLRIATAPSRFDSRDWMVAAGFAAAGGALFAMDRGIRDFWQDNIRSDTSENISKIFDPFGGSKYAFGALIGTYAVSEVLDQTDIYPARRAKAASLLALESVLISSAITGGLKYLTGRERPNHAESQFQFDGPGNGFNRSFPSGHATAAFALASSVSEIYGDDYPWVPWILYPFATGTALSRIDRNKHWASDVFAGAAIGYFVGKVVTRINPFLEEKKLAIHPFANAEEFGTTIVHRF